MSKVLLWTGATMIESYTCDICQSSYLSRVLTDSFTDLDICFECASSGHGGHGGLFYLITQSPEEDGDNLIEVATEMGLIDSEELDYGDDLPYDPENVQLLGSPL